MDLGYLGIFGAYIGMIALCFFWGAWEWKKPEDPGPLFIDLERTIRKKIRKYEFRLSRTHACETPTELVPESVQSDSSGLSQTVSSNETIRVRGDLRIAKGELIPYNMIVEGNLTSQEDVIFQGGLHIKGRAVIGARNRIEKSIVCQKELILFEDVIVYNCIDCDGLVFIKRGVKVGVGQEGGGIASAKTVYLENVEGPLEIHSKDRIRIVGVLMEVVPDELREIIEVKAT